MPVGEIESLGSGVRGARSWKRLDGVDLLRGVSILLVLLNHVNMQLVLARVPYMRGWPRQVVQSLVWNGQAGVQIFFAVSGFLITSTALRRWGSLGGVRVGEFYLLRFARIAPLFIGLLVVLSGLDRAGVKHFVVSAKTGGLMGALFAAVTFHINWLEATRGYLPGNWDILWSLSVEEVFYLVFPWAGRWLRRSWVLIGVLLVLVVLGPFWRARAFDPNPVWREYSYLGGMDAIAMGCLTALMLHGRRLSRRVVRVAGGAGVGLLVFGLCFSDLAYAWGLGRTGLYMTVVGVGACLAIAASAESGWRVRSVPGFVLGPVLVLGRRSYEVYLTHMFVVVAGFGWFARAARSAGNGAPGWGVVLLFVGVIVVAGVLGEGVGRWFSEPVNKWIRGEAGDGAGRLGSVVGAG
jgi:peptidoglycan/LPS O-acetylase OafA/YrhL